METTMPLKRRKKELRLFLMVRVNKASEGSLILSNQTNKCMENQHDPGACCGEDCCGGLTTGCC